MDNLFVKCDFFVEFGNWFHIDYGHSRHIIGSFHALFLFRWFLKIKKSPGIECYLSTLCLGYLKGNEHTSFTAKGGKFVNFMW